MRRDVREVTWGQRCPLWPAPHWPMVACNEVKTPRLELRCFARRRKVEKADDVEVGPFDGVSHGAINDLGDAKLTQSHQTTKAVPARTEG